MYNRTIEKLKKLPFACIALALIVLLSAIFITVSSIKTSQASMALSVKVTFEGDYKIADGEWKSYVRGEKISAMHGDVTFKGKFLLYFDDPAQTYGYVEKDSHIAMYFNHIGGRMSVNGGEFHNFDAENKKFGSSSCGKQWLYYCFDGETGDEVEIVLSNPHSFGNATAVNEFIESMSIYANMSFETSLANKGTVQRTIGFVVIVIAIVLLGVAVFSSALKISQNKLIWLLALLTFFAGGYIVLSSANIVMYSSIVAFNTSGLQICVMLYALFISCLSVYCLTGRLKTVGAVAAALSALTAFIAVIAALSGAVLIYDTAIYWVIAQTAVNATLIGCCAAEMCKIIKTRIFKPSDFKKLTLPIVCILSYTALTVDFILNWAGVWQGGLVSIWVFGVLFVFALIVALKVIPTNYRSSIREKEMRAELQEKRIALTRSQIQPHFLFNTLSSIAELCVTDPNKAQEATVEFTEYLRGNLNAMNNVAPVPVTAELEHVKNYLALEKMRFGEYLQVVYDIRETGFLLPPLSVQPLVENAVKHGIGMKESGGTVKIITYSDEENFYVIVSDDGVGFDSTQKIGEGHIGIENVRYRLMATCKATLEINGMPDEGTVCKITLPKGVSK